MYLIQITQDFTPDPKKVTSLIKERKTPSHYLFYLNNNLTDMSIQSPTLFFNSI